MKYILSAIALLLSVSACKTLTQSSDQPALENTHWKLIALDQKPVDFGDNAFLELKDGDKISGKAACNSFFGEYEARSKSIKFSKIGSTKMFCNNLMDQENLILTNLQKANRYEIRYGMLYLYDSNMLLMTFKK
ncbi:META domain-containing protein [Pedobacter sp. BS3]|uniref:META domain-containing protein n=1 Tax=Pedobacter sp. BS3 TaxID=2567937 RepID=UPI0011F01256|nr:META domain-containing protein [Pedobacter sp. BS3]TZF81465.1 META domain-containing protein [Pedobacter sp. BS3]